MLGTIVLMNLFSGLTMTNEEIRLKIIDLEDKIHDARYYISSDSCYTCEQMYKNIELYQTEINKLKQQLNDIRKGE